MEPIFTLNDINDIIECDYQELCDSYAKQTTTPYGVGRVDFFREVNGYETYLSGRENMDEVVEWYENYSEAIEFANEYNLENKDQPSFHARAVREAVRFDLRSYNGWDGSSRSHRLVESEAEALDWLDENAQFDFEHDGNAPPYFYTREEAEKFLQELIDNAD